MIAEKTMWCVKIFFKIYEMIHLHKLLVFEKGGPILNDVSERHQIGVCIS